jgi:hypothetical protein
MNWKEKFEKGHLSYRANSHVASPTARDRPVTVSLCSVFLEQEVDRYINLDLTGSGS